MITDTSNALRRIEAAEHLELALDASRAGTWHWDMASEKVTWDERLEALHGLGPGQFRSCFEHWVELLHPDEVDGILADVQAALAAPGLYDLLHRTTWPDGSVHWIECRGRVTVNDEGRPTGTIGVAFDVTDRKRIEEELRSSRERFESVARTLQESLLPPELPSIPGIDVAARYVPGGRGVDVGGDFYDLFPLTAGAWGVAIGDVCGKGVVAAKTTALIRYTARAAAAVDDDPATVVRAVNAALRREASLRPSTPTATFVFATLRDGPVLGLQIARGGHPAPMHVRGDGTVGIEPRGAILGVFDDYRIETAELELRPGESLVLYTDGITEAGRSDPFGETRLERCLHTGVSAESLVQSVLNAVAAHQPGGSDDDLALLVLRANDDARTD